jgi:Spy/CpxP family protein refolding chaperone
MKARTILTSVVAVALVAVPMILVAQAGPGSRGPGVHGDGPGGHGLMMARQIAGRFADYLGLSEEQRTQIEGYLEGARAEIGPLVQQSMAARRAHREAQEAGEFNEEQFRALAQEQAGFQVEIKVIAARTMNQVLDVLTDEQKQKLKELKDLMGPRRGFGRRGGRGPGGGPGEGPGGS